MAELSYDSLKSMVEPLLVYIKQRRWFGGKARNIRSALIEDAVPVPFGNSTAYFTFVRIEYAEGEPEIYLLPVAFAEQAASVSPEAVISHSGDKTGILYNALIERELCLSLLEAISKRRRFSGKKGKITAFPSSAFRRLCGEEPMVPTLLEREQTNTSIVYGDRLLLKLFRRLENGVSPELEMGRFLTAKNFPNAPLVAGAIEYSRDGEPITLGILHGYILNKGDAWHYTLDSLKGYFEKALTLPEAEIPPFAGSLLDWSERSLPPMAEELIGGYLVSARLLGQRTAELHLALSSDPDEPGFAPEPLTIAFQRSLFDMMRSSATQVLQLLRQQLNTLPEDVKIDAQKVLNLEKEIIGRFQEIARRKITAMRIRCHGDYHLGQVLYSGTDFVIIDFEGEPARRLGERRTKSSPLRDVAGMIRSFNYAAYSALYEQPTVLPALEKWAKSWYVYVAAAFLRSYLETTKGFKLPLVPENRSDLKTLLDAYLLEKAIYEINYELNNRPNWVRLPLKGILQVLDG